MRPFETEGGVQTRRIAVLNEQHAIFLMTLLRNILFFMFYSIH